MRGASRVAPAFPARSGRGLGSLRMLETPRYAGQHGIHEILQRLLCGQLAVAPDRVNDYQGAVVAAAEQPGFRLQQLGPVRVDDILTVYPVPSPDQQLIRPAVQA